MSKENVKKMFDKISKDAELQKKYVASMQAHRKDAEKLLAEKLIELGKTSGFVFSNEDLMAARAELADKANSNKELSDGDLANVAGGNVGQKTQIGITSLVTFGIGCMVIGIISAANEGQAKGSCGDKLSTTAKC